MKRLVSLWACFFLSACGGGGGGSPLETTPPAVTYTVTGVSSAGGTLSCTSPVPSGGTTSCSIAAATGFGFSGATSNSANCGAIRVAGATLTAGPISGACTITGTFTALPYLEEVAGAFPDPTLKYWFFDSAQPSRPVNYNYFAARVNGTVAVDLNNDRRPELLMTLSKGPGQDVANQGQVLEKCKSETVIYELGANGKFVDATEKFIEGTRDSQSCSGFLYAVVDLNEDGRQDVCYSTNQADGRSLDAGSDMSGYVVCYISQPNGKYRMYKAGAGKYYGSIGYGFDPLGKPFVTAAGTPNDLGEFKQNNKYMWNGSGLATIQDGVLPPMSSSSGWGFRFLSIGGKPSNRLVQHTPYRGYLAAEGFYLSGVTWLPTNVAKPDITQVLATNVPWIIYSGDRKIVDIALYGDRQILVGGGPGSNENFCPVRNGAGEVFIAGLTSFPALRQPYAGQSQLTMDSIESVIEHTGFWFKSDGRELAREKLAIQGETEFLDTKMECIDVNNDGYDDLVMSISSTANRTAAEIVKVYVNQKDKTFRKLNLGDLTKFTLMPRERVDKYMSVIADFDNDGIPDVVVYPDNVRNNLSLDGAIKFFRGMKPLQ